MIDVAAGIILASIPYYFLKVACRILDEEQFQWTPFLLIFAGLAIGAVILFSGLAL